MSEKLVNESNIRRLWQRVKELVLESASDASTTLLDVTDTLRIKWDYNPANHLAVWGAYKVYDTAPEIDYFYPNGYYIIADADGTAEEVPYGSWMIDQSYDDIVSINNRVFLVYAAGAEGHGYVFPEAGVYFFNVEENCHVVELGRSSGSNETLFSLAKLKRSLLPGHRHHWKDIVDPAFGEIKHRLGSDSIHSDGKDYLGLHKVSEAVPAWAFLQSGGSITYKKGGNTHIERFPSSTIELVNNLNGYAIRVKASGLDDWPTTYVRIVREGTDAGTYFQQSSFWGIIVESLTIDGFGGFPYTEVKKIDPKYLPEDIGSVKTVNNIAPDDEGNIDLGEVKDGFSPTVKVAPLDDNQGYNLEITDKNGSRGVNIFHGEDGVELTPENIANALGYTPANEETVNGLSEEIADLRNIINGLSLGAGEDGRIYLLNGNAEQGNGIEIPIGASGDVVGNMGENNVIILTGNLTDGTYTFVYEMEDGTQIEIGTKELTDEPVIKYTNKIPTSINTDGTAFSSTGIQSGKRWSSSGTLSSGQSNTTGLIACKANDIVYLQKCGLYNKAGTAEAHRVTFWNASKGILGYEQPWKLTGTYMTDVQWTDGFITQFKVKQDGFFAVSGINATAASALGVTEVLDTDSIITINEPIV